MISRSTDVRSALKGRQRGFLMNPFRFPRSNNYAEEVLADGPLLYLRLADPSGTTATDSSGNGRHGTVYGGPSLGVAGLLQGSDNAAISLSSSSQYVSVPYGAWMNTGNTLTCEAVVDLTNLQVANVSSVLGRRLGFEGHFHFRVDPSGGVQLVVYTAFGSATIYYCTPPHYVAALGTLHVAATWDNVVLRLYINGVQMSSRYLTAAPYAPPNLPLSVGRDESTPGNNYEAYNGTLDEVAMYGYALSSERIAIHAVEAVGAVLPTPTFQQVVDTATSCYGLRTLKSGYTGWLIRVRRSSDGALLGVTADGSGNLDTAAIAAFAGAGTASVESWYDQTGAAHLTQTNASLQGIIYYLGAQVTGPTGKPTIYFNADYLQHMSAPEVLSNAAGLTVSIAASTGLQVGRGRDGSGSGWSFSMGTYGAAVVFTTPTTDQTNVNPPNTHTGMLPAIASVHNNTNNNSFVRAYVDPSTWLDTYVARRNLRASTVGFQVARLNTSYTSGHVGEMFVHNRMLTDQEVATLYTGMDERFAA